jgi:hypothetical protein
MTPGCSAKDVRIISPHAVLAVAISALTSRTGALPVWVHSRPAEVQMSCYQFRVAMSTF